MPTHKLPKDPLLPQLQTMWNADLMRDVFSQRLRPLLEKIFEIENCKILRFRYRPATRSIVFYELLLRKTTSKDKKTIWITGTTYPENHAKKRYDTLQAISLEQATPAECFPFEPVSFIPDLKMVTQIFPFDRYLPALLALMAEQPRELKELFMNQFGAGLWRIEGWRVEPVRYRAFICATFRYTINALEEATNRLTSKYFYVKVIRSRGKLTYDMLQRLYLQFSEGKDGFTTVRPLSYLEDLNCLVLETARGVPLEQLILNGKEVNGAISKSAAALAKFNQSDLVFPEEQLIEGPLSVARKAASFIQWACPDLNKRVEKIICKLEAHPENRMEKIVLCPTHLDIKVDHIFIDGDQVIFIDLDSFAFSDPVFDPASFLVQIEMLPTFSSVPPSRIQTISRIFKEDYFSRVPKSWRNRLPANYACAALKVALYFIQHMETDWQVHVTKIISRIEEVLSAGYEEVQ